MEQPPTPPALAALDAFPALRAAVEPGLSRQQTRIAACLARLQPRPQLLDALAAALDDPAGGLVLLEGPPGSGVTSLLCALAARGPRPLWLAGDAPGEIASLYAQIVALRRPAVPLLDPTATTDPAALEGLLAEVSGPGRPPLTLLIDDLDPPGQRLRPGPTPLPAELPPGVTLLLGAAPGAYLPYPVRARITLRDDGPELPQAQRRALEAMGCEPAWVEPICAASGGSFLYLGLARAMLAAGALLSTALPDGLDGLLHTWWRGLDTAGRRLAALLAAAGEPLPLRLVEELHGANPRWALARWARLGVVEVGATPQPEDEEGRGPVALVAFAHRAYAGAVATLAPRLLGRAHDDLAAAGLQRVAQERDAGRGGLWQAGEATAAYLDRQLGRHLAHAPAERRDMALPALVDRQRLLSRERRGLLADGVDEARWELRMAAAAGTELRLARAALVAGVVAERARTLSAEAAVGALEDGLAGGGREAHLKRVLELAERLPDGQEKALILRRLGEVAYQRRMRSSAMRLLSRALDLEAAPRSRAWRDSREALLAALALGALELGAVDEALAIGERIEHLERRAQVETEVVRALLGTGERDRAQRLARSILHESMGAWARAEAGVNLLRAGDARGQLLLDELTLETVVAWAQIELACDEVVRDEAAARRRIAALPTQGQRDRALARVARVLAAADDDGAALAAAEAIVAVDVRVAALIELRLGLEGLVAMLALERATSDIGGVSGDDRAPLVAALAAALAAIGRRDRALELAETLPAGEERDRALARVAVGLGQRGEHAAARELLAAVGDEDERGWALEELARQLAGEGRWAEAATLAAQIEAADQRARALADLAVARARAGQPLPALADALALAQPAERARALTLIGPELVAGGATAEALQVARREGALATAETRARYLAALVRAMARRGEAAAALDVVVAIRRPAERARAGAQLAHALAAGDPALARRVLGAALRSAAVGREELFRAMELAVPALGALGGAALLAAIAATVDEVDRWV